MWRGFLRFLIVALCRETFKVKHLNNFKQIQDQREMQATKTVVDNLVGVRAVSLFVMPLRNSASERDTKRVLREFDYKTVEKFPDFLFLLHHQPCRDSKNELL